MAAIPKPKTVKDPAYLAYVRTLPCWARRTHPHICRDTLGKGLSECSHLDGKSRDDRVLPLCGLAHRTAGWGWHAGQRSFCRYFNTTKKQLIQEAESLYAAFQESHQ